MCVCVCVCLWPAQSADVRDPEAVDKVVDAALAEFGHFEILINGAAGNFLCSADKLSRNAYKTVLEIDTVGTWNCTKAAYTKWFKVPLSLSFSFSPSRSLFA